MATPYGLYDLRDETDRMVNLTATSTVTRVVMISILHRDLARLEALSAALFDSGRIGVDNCIVEMNGLLKELNFFDQLHFRFAHGGDGSYAGTHGWLSIRAKGPAQQAVVLAFGEHWGQSAPVTEAHMYLTDGERARVEPEVALAQIQKVLLVLLGAVQGTASERLRHIRDVQFSLNCES